MAQAVVRNLGGRTLQERTKGKGMGGRGRKVRKIGGVISEEGGGE